MSPRPAPRASARTPQSDAEHLSLMLVMMRLFDLEGNTVKDWLMSSRATVDSATQMMMSGSGAHLPYGAITDAVHDEHAKQLKEISATLKASGADFKTIDAVDTLTNTFAESAAWYGVLLGWRLRGMMADPQDGVR